MSTRQELLKFKTVSTGRCGGVTAIPALGKLRLRQED
jgi:hypothetical protein